MHQLYITNGRESNKRWKTRERGREGSKTLKNLLTAKYNDLGQQ